MPGFEYYLELREMRSVDCSGINSSGYQTCPKCSKPYYTLYPATTDGGVCECTDEIKSKQYGWICPACGCGNAGWSSKCGHCIPKPPQSRSGSTEIW